MNNPQKIYTANPGFPFITKAIIAAQPIKVFNNGNMLTP